MEKFFLLDENFVQPKTPSWHCYRKSSYLFGKNLSTIGNAPGTVRQKPVPVGTWGLIIHTGYYETETKSGRFNQGH